MQGLNLSLFIDTQHQCMIRRVQVQAYDVAHLLGVERIGGEYEAAGAMGLEREGLEQPVHRGFGDATGAGRFAHRPVRARCRLARQRALQQRSNLLVPDSARASGA